MKPRRTLVTGQWAIEGCDHHRREGLPYTQWHAWADKQIEAGQNQTMCKACKLWLFPCEIGKVAPQQEF